MRPKSEQPDHVLLMVILLIVIIGVVMVFSASFPLSIAWYGHGLFFFNRQLVWALVGFCAMLVASKINYWKWQQLAPLLVLGTLLALLLLYVPGVGVRVQGSTRWLDFRLFNVQPSEIAKVTLVMWVAARVAKKEKLLQSFWHGTFPILVVSALVAGIVLLQPDLSTAVVIALAAAFVLFAGGLPLGQVLFLGGLGLVFLYFAVIAEGYRMERYMAFLNPWKDPLDTGYQIIQSLYAIGLGGLFGQGPGQSIQKFAFLPDPHNDFIFAITSEELGFFGGALLIGLFGMIAVRGLIIAMRAPDKFGSLLATGITATIVSQAFINIGVVTASLPVTGITLPLVSYGGSSLVIVLGSLGILLNVSKYRRE